MDRSYSLVLRALELDSPEERDRFLDRECGDDLQLRSETQELLKTIDEADAEGFMEKPPTLVSAVGQFSESPLRVGDTVAEFQLIEEIGSGGFGQVFLARHIESENEFVAIKVLKREQSLTSEVLERFEAEQKTLQLMSHPFIAEIFAEGVSQTGQPYFILEYVNGIPIDRYCDELHLTVRERLKLFMKVCQGLENAHMKGIVHRDLKPTNILIAEENGEPIPKIIDFGISKLVGNETPRQFSQTKTGMLVGTPAYMSPEQVISSKEISPRSDIFSLGVLLYELLTGMTPFRSGSAGQIFNYEYFRRIREEEPRKPSTCIDDTVDSLITANRSTNSSELKKELSGSLDSIVMSALEKHPDDRYATVSEYNTAVEKYLTHNKGISPLSRTLTRVQKLSRANKKSLVWGSSIVFVLCLGIFWVNRMTAQSGDWMGRANAAAFSDQHRWLEPCKIVLLVETGAEVKLEETAEYVASLTSRILPPGLLAFHSNRRAEVVETIQKEGDWLLWEMPLSLDWDNGASDNDGISAVRNSGVVPSESSVKLRFAISSSGAFQIGTLGESVDEQLTVLAMHQGITNYKHFGGSYLPSNQTGEIHDMYTDLGVRQNLLTSWFGQLFQQLASNHFVSNGPAHFGELYQCPMTIRNHFETQVVVLQGMIYHEQMDYENFPSVERKIRKTANARWSPLADNPDQDSNIALNVQLEYFDQQPSVLFVRTRNDRDNRSQFILTGIDIDPADYYQFHGDPEERETSSVALDLEAGECRGEQVNVANSVVLLSGQNPSQIEMSATSTWSNVSPVFRYVRMGQTPTATATSSAVVILKDGTEEQVEPQEIDLHVWTIPPFAP